MTSHYASYTPSQMHKMLQEYQPGVRGHGFKALAKKFNIQGGAGLIRSWFRKWDGTEKSLIKSSGDHSSILTEKEKKRYINDFITKASDVEAVTYPEVLANVEKKTRKRPSIATVRRYGKEFKITSKKRKIALESEGMISLFFQFSC